MPHMLEALKVMIGIHPSISSFDKIYTIDWDVLIKNDASKYINILLHFTFIVSIITLYGFFPPNSTYYSKAARSQY